MYGLKTIFLNLLCVNFKWCKYNGEFNDVFLNHESVHLCHKAMTALPQLVFNFAPVRAKYPGTNRVKFVSSNIDTIYFN